ncbi:hypothetical protein Tco_0974412 [Tanacetum coccineum]|uniref:Uncharacterized protein n=1 Tax=Tanacetum coccineum TaxID=301880 RepID=A0ABQ5EBH9_9ASTR
MIGPRRSLLYGAYGCILVTARDEKWVPSTERVKISPTNVRLETTVPQKEETFQVVIDKVKDSESYKFLLANKKCIVDAEVFRKILDICPRDEGEEFTESWRTLAAVINKCLSRKTASNDRLRKYRIDILWGIFYRENVNYPELIWEDFAFHIDHKKERKSRHENMCLAWMLLIDLCEVYLPVPVMAISVISISSDSSEDSVGTPAGRVILFGTIPTTIPDTTPVITPPATQTDTPVIPTETPIIAPTIPPSPDYTPASPDYSHASDSESDPYEDPSSDHVPPLPAISPFLSSDDDTTDIDTPDTPPSPTHDTPFTEITASTKRSPIIPRRRVMILSPGQPIPHGWPYCYHLNGPVHMMTARKRVGPLPTHLLAMRHSADYCSSDSSSEASSDFHSDASSDPSSRHSLSDHSSPNLPSTSAGPSHKRCRSPMTSVPTLSPISGALSPVRADLIPSPKRVKDSGYLADVEVDHRELSLRGDAIVRVSNEPHLEQDIDPEIQEKIDECIAYADALRDRGIDARVVVEAVDRDET